MSVMPALVEWLVGLLVLAGGAFCLIGSIGLLRMPTFFSRLHGPGKASTMGVLCVLIGAMFHFFGSEQGFAMRELLISGFIAVTAPVGAYLLGKAGLDANLPGSKPPDNPAP